jgi:uncharacterized FlaG/YvyC family protein
MGVMKSMELVSSYYPGTSKPAVLSLKPQNPASQINQSRKIQERFIDVEFTPRARIAEGITRFFTSKGVRVEFFFDKNTRQIKLRVIDNESGRTIREIPEKVFSEFFRMTNNKI